jgi:hypothetical protein
MNQPTETPNQAPTRDVKAGRSYGQIGLPSGDTFLVIYSPDVVKSLSKDAFPNFMDS